MLKMATLIFEDGSMQNYFYYDPLQPTGQVPEHLITWRGEPSSVDYRADMDDSEDDLQTQPYEWYD